MLLPFIVTAALLNGLLQYCLSLTNLPLFMDSTFTIFAGFMWGPLAGAAVGLLTNLLMELLHGCDGLYFPFALVNIFTGLMAGLWKIKKYKSNYIAMLIFWGIIIIGNSILGTLVVEFFFNGLTGTSVDSIIESFVLTGQSILSAAFLGRIIINLIDKSLALCGAWLLSFWLEARERGKSTLE
ncbi:MAG: hypothetical protein PF447_07045 [Spirochaetaceae bacterium]|nr:hypothetical protein [Spirochaetaceae bacterium]